jgi:hypothetical protein
VDSSLAFAFKNGLDDLIAQRPTKALALRRMALNYALDKEPLGHQL